MTEYDYINCPNCFSKYRIPHTNQALKITCKNCHEIFYINLQKPVKKRKKKYPIIMFFTIIALAIIVLKIIDNQELQYSNDIGSKSNTTITGTTTRATNWVTISYGKLVDKSIITHKSETVGEIIKKIPRFSDDIKGLVQQYLEPYSILCHDVLLTTIKPDSLPLINILTYYPIGSEQPAWADLFREGHFQLYFNNKLIRIFLEGNTISQGLRKYFSIIRHPIIDIINSKSTSIDKIEIYVFQNDYAKTEIKLNTIPEVYNARELDLSPKHNDLDLSSIAEFLNQGVVLEAMEVDDNNNLFLYGRKNAMQTLAGFPISLSDIAVVYRSVYHYGYNAPYISLDKNEDNRFAKVNFGGHLENTHVGSVVLEADKLFKTLSTGIDPNSHNLEVSRIAKVVPNFLTEDERSLLEFSGSIHTQIRYWFYPDSIGTVTDGSIGAVLRNQFLADVERMDIKKNEGEKAKDPLIDYDQNSRLFGIPGNTKEVSNAVRETIDHLNNNFALYEKAENAYKELSTVGRIMALINWLKGMHMEDRVELDDLLSVRIPAYTTPETTKKMLAITAVSKPSNLCLSKHNIRSYTKSYYISDLLNKYDPITSDDKFLDVAKSYFSNIDISKLAPSGYTKLKTEINYYRRLIKSSETKINKLNNDIDRMGSALDRNNSSEVDHYNEIVNQYNDLLATHKFYVTTCKSKIDQLNNMNISHNYITSIGGGINLRPSEFSKIIRNPDASILREINAIKGEIESDGKVSRYDNWIRNNSSATGRPITNQIPFNSWISSKTVRSKSGITYHSKSGDLASTEFSTDQQVWKYNTVINGSQDVVDFSQASNQLLVKHSIFGKEFRGEISPDGKTIIFSKN